MLNKSATGFIRRRVAIQLYKMIRKYCSLHDIRRSATFCQPEVTIESCPPPGARRIELCCGLSEGGITPSTGMVEVVKQLTHVPVYVMIRPRGGDFCYDSQEFEVMRRDLKTLKTLNVDGFVFGILNKDGTVDTKRCQELLDLARPLPVTFHRAIDMAANIMQALQDVMRLGCERVLTSGGESTALEGAPVIRRMVEKAEDSIIIVPGGGINEKNLRRILDETGAREFHASARITRDSYMEHKNLSVAMGGSLSPPEYNIKLTSRDRVRSMVTIARETL